MSAKEIAVDETWYPLRSQPTPWKIIPHPLIIYTVHLRFGRTSERLDQSETHDLQIVDTMASATKTRSKKLVALKDRLNRLLAELDELCIGATEELCNRQCL
ncbi:hypothetical protein T02_14859 [Trichinella nativa]|uniref:Uncharacterized protein n=1 Tax=Trichinella nativa TaxID=6335 RepID=A0A0V1KMN3_9BILA|nr:hypothetical protein T02_14859 [Trichinella nativa]